MEEITQQAVAMWFIGLCCLIGEKDKDYYLPETDPVWWELYLLIKRN